jgi:tRNA G18 (ribose-2'-O)-methylase SpoU
MPRGYFAIGICHSKSQCNVGTLWRSAKIFGAAFIFTVGRRYSRQPSDTMKSWRTVPLLHFATVADLITHVPFSCPLVGLELDERAKPVEEFRHPERCIYLLGAEDHGLTTQERDMCHKLLRLPGESSMNVASAGTVVMYDRWLQSRSTSQCTAMRLDTDVASLLGSGLDASGGPSG